MQKIIIVGIGGFIGATLRYLISIQSNKILGIFLPYGTLIANVLACFLIGFFIEGSLEVFNISPNMKLFLTTGFLGGLSTFSTFSYETMAIFSSNFLLAGFNILLNLSFGMLGIWVGKYVIQLIK